MAGWKHPRILRGDLAGGLSATVVSLPLALAFGELSGAGPVAGFYSAVCVGLGAALFGGTAVQVAGPTGPTALVMVALFAQFVGEPAKAFTVVMLAGLFQILFGALKMGRYISLLPYPVMSGWASGIGCTIILMSLAPFSGLTLAMHPTTALGELPEYLTETRADTLLLGFGSLGLMLFCPKALARRFPPSLLSLILGTLAGALWLTDAPTLGPTGSGWPDWQMPVFDLADINTMLFSALFIALLGSIDSVLASMAADHATQTFHDTERELIGQGIGNLVAGFAGGIAGAGATLRTMTNVSAGGRTKWSAVICALMMLAVVLTFGRLFAYIPAAVLSGVLIKIAIDTIDWRYLKRVRTAPRSGVLLMFTVMALTIVFNLVVAAAVGFVLASLMFVKRMADLQLESVHAVDNPSGEPGLNAEDSAMLERLKGRAMLIRFSGPISFGAANRLHRRISGYQDYDCVMLDLTEVPDVDSSATLALENIIVNSRKRDHIVILIGLSTPVARTFARLGILDLIREIERYPTRTDALRYAIELLQPGPATGQGEQGRAPARAGATK